MALNQNFLHMILGSPDLEAKIRPNLTYAFTAFLLPNMVACTITSPHVIREDCYNSKKNMKTFAFFGNWFLNSMYPNLDPTVRCQDFPALCKKCHTDPSHVFNKKLIPRELHHQCNSSFLIYRPPPGSGIYSAMKFGFLLQRLHCFLNSKLSFFRKFHETYFGPI